MAKEERASRSTRCASGAIAAALVLLARVAAAQLADPVCLETPRLPHDNPLYAAQRELLGFHDEELVLCSPGHEHPVRITARLWVPRDCPGVGGCPGVLMAHGFAFTKETTIADMQNAARRGMYVLSYDVRGHGLSGDQVGLMGREDAADQRHLLEWFHEHVRPTKVGVYGISQGGALAFMAAIFNCGRDRAAEFDSAIPCDEGGRLVDAIAPVQAPTTFFEGDGTCSTFALEAIVQSRGNLALARGALECIAEHTPLEELGGEVTAALPTFDGSIRDTLSRVDRIDVPAYILTSFLDRLVPPQNSTAMYERLRERALAGDYDADLRLAISNDGHGAIGANFAVLDDVFAWFALQLGDSPVPLREAPVAIAQEWAGNTFRLESEWPIPEGRETRTLHLSRPSGASPGALVLEPDEIEGSADELKSLPVVSSAPEAPFLGFVSQLTAGFARQELPLTRLAYQTEPATALVEITDLPVVTLWVSSANGSGDGLGQLHVALSEVAGDTVTEFARSRIGLAELSGEPREIVLPLSVSSHRIDPGSRLLLTITPTDPGQTLPALTLDSFFVHHDAAHPSSVRFATIDPERTLPPSAGEPPSGPAFPADAVEVFCGVLGLECPAL